MRPMACVGVSAYGTDCDVAVRAANDAALDELVNLIGIRIGDAWFKDNVLAGYSSARTKMLATMQNAGPRAEEVFVRYDVTLDAVKSLVERYSTKSALHGSSVVTAFPGLAWQYPDFDGGVMFEKVAGPLAASAQPLHVITAVNEEKITDASTLMAQLNQTAKGAEATLTVRAVDGAPTKISFKA